MKIQWMALLITLSLYGAAVLAFCLADKFDYKRGANDMGNSLLSFAIATLVIGVFFIRSIYQAIAIDSSYWMVAGLHVVCILLFMRFFMT